jgi:hypothetical protein
MMTAFAPRRALSSAIARPRPVEPPVTKTIWSEQSALIESPGMCVIRSSCSQHSPSNAASSHTCSDRYVESARAIRRQIGPRPLFRGNPRSVMTRHAVIVSTARTPIDRAFRCYFNASYSGKWDDVRGWFQFGKRIRSRANLCFTCVADCRAPLGPTSRSVDASGWRSSRYRCIRTRRA